MMNSLSATTNAKRNFEEYNLEGCRRNQYGKMSALDAIGVFEDCSRKIASQKNKRFLTATPNIVPDYWKFPSDRSGKTPILSYEEIKALFAYLQGQKNTSSADELLPPYDNNDPPRY